jgi:hypothetical protein
MAFTRLLLFFFRPKENEQTISSCIDKNQNAEACLSPHQLPMLSPTSQHFFKKNFDRDERWIIIE